MLKVSELLKIKQVHSNKCIHLYIAILTLMSLISDLRFIFIYFLLTFLEYIYKFGVLPGTGMPALVSFMKYFCTRLAT